MSVIDDIANHLETNMSLFTSIKIDILSEDDNAITIRRYQSSPSQRFLDWAIDDIVGIQVLVRNTDQKVAVDTIEALKNHLEMLKILDTDGTYQFLSCDVYINPLLVEKDDRGCYLYSVLFFVKIFKGG